MCLVAAIVLAVFGGVVYYGFLQRHELAPEDGSFVWRPSAAGVVLCEAAEAGAARCEAGEMGGNV